MCWDHCKKQTKEISAFWWLWIISGNGRLCLSCLKNPELLWLISRSMRLFSVMVIPCKFTLIEDLTSHQCCFKTTGYWQNSDNTLKSTINRMVKRLNHTLENMQEIKQRKWDQLLPLLSRTYRCASHESAGCTPNDLMFQRDVRLPVDLIGGALPVPPLDYNQYAWNLREQIQNSASACPWPFEHRESMTETLICRNICRSNETYYRERRR